MVQIALVGLGAGAASALLFASVTSGSVLAIILAYLAPLPILIAAIGWSHWAGLVAAIAAALGLAAGFANPLLIVSFLVATGLPAWWLGYLTLLARNDGGSVEWYPPGRLLFWCAVVSALMMLIVIPVFGLKDEAFRRGIQNFFETAMRQRPASPGQTADMSSEEIRRLADAFLAVMPPLAAGVSTLINAVNLYLAARIIRVSGLLRRPWPDLREMRFPPLALAIFALSCLMCFLPGAIGVSGAIVLAAITVAYGILGLAVVHGVTRSIGNRTFVLSALYGTLMLFWPAITLLALLGVADTIFDFRNRGHGRPPVAPS